MPSNDLKIPRYSIYFAPKKNSPLAIFGADVLADGDISNDHPCRHTVTRKAAHYGFHATLKAPLEIRSGSDEGALLSAVEKFAQRQQRVPLIGLQPRVLNQFHALTVTDASSVNAFASDVVNTFEPFRAPLTETDRQRRNPGQLSAAQLAYLDEYGYPFVHDEFRFHMTLSNRTLNKAESASYHDWLVQRFDATVTEPVWLDQLAVFWQPTRDTAFTRIAAFAVN